MSRKSVSFFEDSGHIYSIVISEATLRKQNKRFIEVCLLVEVASKEDKKVIFGE